MELFQLIFFGILYCLITFFSGRIFLAFLKINYRNEVLNFITGFFIVEASSFLFFIIFGLLRFKEFYLSFLPNIIFLALSIVYLLSKKRLTFLSEFKWPAVLWQPAIFIFVMITGLHFLSATDLFLNVLNLSGLIYQDIIYHGGIVHSIINFGYPVHDLQFNGKVLNYHIFTHFLSAKISYITFTNVFISYHIFLNFLGTLCYSFISVSLFQTIYNSIEFRSKYIKLIIGASSFIAFFSTFWLGGVLNYGFVTAFYLSSSFQWQLIIFLLMFNILFFTDKEKVYFKHILILLLLFFISILIKVSSLPLMIAGIGAVFFYHTFYSHKENLKFWIQLFFLFLILGVIIFMFFFSVGDSQSSTLEFNIDLLKLTPVIAFFRINSLFLSLVIYALTVLSFRFILIYKVKNEKTWFAGSMLLSGIVLSLLVKENQLYFILPAIIVSSHLAIVHFFTCKFNKFVWVLILLFLVPSFYPIGSLGITLNDILKRKDHYYPLHSERLELYTFIKDNSYKNDVFFTTTHYSSPDLMAHNYSPAAFSERKAFLGGFRFGGVEFEKEFPERLEISKKFNFQNVEIWRYLQDQDIKLGIIEYQGNFDNSILSDTLNINEDLYQIIFKNNQGIIFKIIPNQEN